MQTRLPVRFCNIQPDKLILGIRTQREIVAGLQLKAFYSKLFERFPACSLIIALTLTYMACSRRVIKTRMGIMPVSTRSAARRKYVYNLYIVCIQLMDELMKTIMISDEAYEKLASRKGKKSFTELLIELSDNAK